MSEDSRDKTVLVVEDDAATRNALTFFLEGEGYTVCGVENGQEALDHLRRNALPNVVLLDLTMPVMGGCEFLRLQKQDPALASIPVIVLSADGEVAGMPELFGDVGCVQKPVDADLLLAAIRRFTAFPKPRVLVVEDERAVLQMLDVALRHYGFRVTLAASGEEAVELYRQNHGKIDVVLLDVQMPGMDGPATLAALQKINAGVRCCFMSGHTGRYSEKELLSMGAAHVLPKPFVSLSLLTRLLWDVVCPR